MGGAGSTMRMPQLRGAQRLERPTLESNNSASTPMIVVQGRYDPYPGTPDPNVQWETPREQNSVVSNIKGSTPSACPGVGPSVAEPIPYTPEGGYPPDALVHTWGRIPVAQETDDNRSQPQQPSDPSLSELRVSSSNFLSSLSGDEIDQAVVDDSNNSNHNSNSSDLAITFETMLSTDVTAHEDDQESISTTMESIVPVEQPGPVSESSETSHPPQAEQSLTIGDEEEPPLSNPMPMRPPLNWSMGASARLPSITHSSDTIGDPSATEGETRIATARAPTPRSQDTQQTTATYDQLEQLCRSCMESEPSTPLVTPRETPRIRRRSLDPLTVMASSVSDLVAPPFVSTIPLPTTSNNSTLPLLSSSSSNVRSQRITQDPPTDETNLQSDDHRAPPGL